MKTRLLHTAMFTPLADGRWGLPLLLWGPPGVAKTAIVEATGAAVDFHVEPLSPGERGEGAFGVTPVPVQNGSGTVLEYPPPDWVRNLISDKAAYEEKKTALIDATTKITHETYTKLVYLTATMEQGIVFLDEINSAPPALAPALLGAIQARRIGGHKFGPRVRVFGAANPVGHAAGGWDLAAPVANRLGHIDWPSPDADEWAAWLVGGDSAIDAIDAEQEEARVLKAWPEAWAKAAGLAAAFIRRRPELLHKMPADGDEAQSRAWPSPRSWEYATRSMAAAKIHGLDELETDELVAAFVGTAAASEWITWIEEQDLPDPAELLDGKIKWQHDPTRLDRTDAVLQSCSALVIPAAAAKRKERTAAIWGLLAAVMKDAKDLVVPSMTALAKAGLQRGAEARPVLAALDPVRQAIRGVA